MKSWIPILAPLLLCAMVASTLTSCVTDAKMKRYMEVSAKIEKFEAEGGHEAELEALKAEASALKAELDAEYQKWLAAGGAAGGATGLPGGALYGSGAVVLAWAVWEYLRRKKAAS